MLPVRVHLTTFARSTGNSPIRYGLCTGQISLPNSCKNRMHGTFSAHAERLHVRVIDIEIRVDSYNSGRCPATDKWETRLERPFAYRLSYCPFGNCIISYACRFCKTFLVKLYTKYLHAVIYF